VKTIKIIIFLIAASLVGFLFFNNIRDFKEVAHTDEGLVSPALNNKQSAEIDGKEYEFAWIQITNPENIFLYPNFEERYTLEEGVEKYDCRNLTSGGFYTETNSPIGLFISEEGMLSDKTVNNLFNGYFVLTKKNEATISRDYSGEPVRIGLQAGPILIQSGVVQKLALASDKMARRIVVALTEEGEIYFITIFDKESVFMGPLLADLPELISNIQDKIDMEFISALNLDGGSASAFYTQNIQLSELTPVGSFFCEK
jgi:uncharacterized protein YigE (DUF2233 family)